MRLSSTFAIAAVSAATTALAAPSAARQASEYVGYLISTFTDADPKVHWYLSDGNSATSFAALNGGNAVVASTVGTKGVRDIFLTTNSARDEFFLIATGKHGPFSVMRHGQTRVIVQRS